MPHSIAAINGGFFHFLTPSPSCYEWDGVDYVDGDPVGELVVNQQVINKNPEKKHWGAFRIDLSGRASIVDTNSDELDGKKIRYSLGSAPVLIKNGVSISSDEFASPPTLVTNRVATPGDFLFHLYEKTARSGICLDKKNDLLFVIVEGRQKRAEGYDLFQFAKLLESLGCENALNLDGGGSADLMTRNSEGDFTSTITSSDAGKKRPVGNAFVITEKL